MEAIWIRRFDHILQDIRSYLEELPYSFSASGNYSSSINEFVWYFFNITYSFQALTVTRSFYNTVERFLNQVLDDVLGLIQDYKPIVYLQFKYYDDETHENYIQTKMFDVEEFESAISLFLNKLKSSSVNGIFVNMPGLVSGSNAAVFSHDFFLKGTIVIKVGLNKRT